MLNAKSVSLIIPARNEAASIAKMLGAVPSFIDEVIVVDNCSTDQTAKVAKSLGAKVISEKRKDARGIGYGYAHRSGIKAAKGDLIVAMDADGTYPLNEMKNVLKFMGKNSLDFVSCRRFPLLKKAAISPIRQFGVWILNTETRIFYGYPTHDILSGMWAMTSKAAKRLNLKEGGWNLSPEIKLNAMLDEAVAFGEYHIDHNYRLENKSKQKIWQTGLDHFSYILTRWLTIDGFIAKGYQVASQSLGGLLVGKAPRIAVR